MRLVVACVVGLALAEGAAAAQPKNLDVGMSESDRQLRAFYIAIGDYFGVPPRRGAALRERCRCRDEELPVAFFLAAHARVDAGAVLELRVQGLSWLDIASHYRLAPDIFFVRLRTEPAGPPYGRAYGYYRTRGGGRGWARSALADFDVVALVNLRFLSEHYRVPPETVIEMSGWQVNFVAMNDAMTRVRAQKATQNSRGGPKKQ